MSLGAATGNSLEAIYLDSWENHLEPGGSWEATYLDSWENHLKPCDSCEVTYLDSWENHLEPGGSYRRQLGSYLPGQLEDSS